MTATLRSFFFGLTSLTLACSGSSTTSPPPADSSVADASGDSITETASETADTTPFDAPPAGACKIASDCGWGEIPHEIIQKTDCVCLFGCGYIPQSKETIARRMAQYKALCDPTKDGTGKPCGIDDCAPPGTIDCIAGTCAAAKPDAASD